MWWWCWGVCVDIFIACAGILFMTVAYHSVGNDLFSVLLYVRPSLLYIPIRGSLPGLPHHNLMYLAGRIFGPLVELSVVFGGRWVF